MATSQATTGTVGSSIVTAQPPASSTGYSAFFRFFNPISAGFEGALGQSADAGSTASLDAAGHLVAIANGLLSTFIAGPGALPPGYAPLDLAGDVTFAGGAHRDDFRSPDGSVIIGRWEGGTVAIGGRAFDLGPRSVSYAVVTPTPAGIVGSFTGTATYSLAAATAPTDGAGHAGSVSSATIAANFSARTVTGSFALGINGQSFSLSGTSGLDPGASGFAFASALGTLDVGCTGSCSSAGYLGTVNGQFAGSAGRWIAINYRVNPNRNPQSGFSDFVVGSMALQSGASPTIGIVLPQSGTASLVFTSVDPAVSFSTYPGASGAPSITGTVQANFTAQTASFNATVSGGCGCTNPTFTATASSMPIVGAGFSASTDASRPSSTGAMTVACSGSGCGSPGTVQGRFDGLFRNSSATSGVASIVVGDSAGAYQLVANLGPPGAQLAAADARAASQHVTPPAPVLPTASTIMHPLSRVARIQ